MTRDAAAASPPLLLGAHFSIAGGLHQALVRARQYRCTAAQLFTKNASTWKERTLTESEVAAFRQAMAETGICAVAAHAAYLINPAADETEKQRNSRDALVGELVRADRLGIDWVVLHPGSHRGAGEAAGLSRAIEMIRWALDRTPDVTTRLLVETMAGQGDGIGHRFEHIATILDGVRAPERVGACLDTSHVFAAGYDLRDAAAYEKTMSAFSDIVGIERLFVIHVNDSLKPLDSRIDRHAHIGRGEIGPIGFRQLMTDSRLEHIPKLIETPKVEGKTDWDRINLNRLRKMARAL